MATAASQDDSSRDGPSADGPSADGSSRDGPSLWQRLCPSADLIERRLGLRFDVSSPQGVFPAFVLRIDGKPFAWLNRCAHVPVELDGTPGEFLDDTGRVIVCATHGAVYDPSSGRCLRGPCKGRALHAVPCREQSGWIEAAVRLS